MEIHLLDMGQTKYGDCLVITEGGRKILIDAGHPGDFDRITSQLRSVLNAEPPFEFDLIVVTHCHADHIGCMPRLVSENIITATTALVADEDLGFGRGADGISGIDAVLSPAERKLLYALQEEPADDLDDASLLQFIEDAATLEEKYRGMLDALQQAGTNILRYGKSPAADITALEAGFAEFGFKVLGPTPQHLAICAATIAASVDAVVNALQASPAVADDRPSLTSAYRHLLDVLARQGQSFSDAPIEDRPGVGAAKNDQSIVIRVAADGWRALLTGDMQFAEPEVTDLDLYMTALRQTLMEDIAADGAYDFVKLSHHTSYNGFDETVFAEWSGTSLYAHTGGRNDPTHPDAGVLELLASHSDTIQFARTDRNGLITASKVGARPALVVSRGELNNFSRNRSRRAHHDEPTSIGSARGSSSRVTMHSQHHDGDFVEVVARVPHTSTRVTLTIDVQPGEKKKPPVNGIEPEFTNGPRDRGGKWAQFEGNGGGTPPKGPAGIDRQARTLVRLGGGRAIKERLLFVTQRDQLARNVGQREADAACKAITDAKQRLLNLSQPGLTVENSLAEVRRALQADNYDGVVLLGGYDVAPSARLDVLDAKLRSTVTNLGLIDKDADRFLVWSDTFYGDIDGDTIPELPVSRIPDGRRADVLLAALQAPAARRIQRAGIRNLNRPFAEDVYAGISNLRAPEMLVCEPVPPFNQRRGNQFLSDIYVMMHGSDIDATRYWGEDQQGDLIEGMDIDAVPRRAPGAIVFTGCCWGALPVVPTAHKLKSGVSIRPRGPEQSIAIAFLKAGALAFVGCTGTHYSPVNPIPPYGLDFFGKPLHDLFWRNINAGKGPAKALFDAKVEFAAKMPHGPDDPYSRAVEMKIVRQFTLLGLGW